jgi:hypothetical protein
MPSQEVSHRICTIRSGLGWLDMFKGSKSAKREAYNKCMSTFGYVGGTRKNKRSKKNKTRSK